MNHLPPSWIHTARLVRRSFRRGRQMVRWMNFGLKSVPVLFSNSFPKSGTHLLTQVISGLSSVGPAVNSGLPAIQTYYPENGFRRTEAEIITDLGRLLPGDTAYGHLHASPPIVDLLCQDGFASYFILRDPRDVVVSHVFYVTEMEVNHIHHQYYAHTLQTFEQRLLVSILGRNDADVEFGNITSRFQPYLDWMNRPEILVIHFEDFRSDRSDTIQRILAHAVLRGFPLKKELREAIQILSDHIDPNQSPTFRSGKSGTWKETFNENHKRIFKEVAGELLINLGYEKDFAW